MANSNTIKADEMRNQVGNSSHKDCSSCKKQKTEHLFCEKPSGWSGKKWFWKCMNCGRETDVYSN